MNFYSEESTYKNENISDFFGYFLKFKPDPKHQFHLSFVIYS
jgi:hypothetical protein